MRALAAASPRVEVFQIGTSEEGREMILVVVGSEESIAALDANKAALRRLADPRITTPEEAAGIIGTAKPIYWSAGAIHSPETGSPEMFMELAYRLAVGESEFIRDIRDNLIYMMTPVVEPDGRAKVVDLHMARHKDPDANTPTRPLYWGQYVAHDNNRDNIGLSLALSRAVTNTYLEYRPTVFHDHHESASHLYTSTGRGPYNAWLDPIVINEWKPARVQGSEGHDGLRRSRRLHLRLLRRVGRQLHDVGGAHAQLDRPLLRDAGRRQRIHAHHPFQCAAPVAPAQHPGAAGRVGNPEQRQPAAERRADRHARGRDQSRGIPAQLLPEIRAFGREGAQ